MRSQRLLKTRKVGTLRSHGLSQSFVCATEVSPLLWLTAGHPDSFSRVDLAALSDQEIRRRFHTFPVWPSWLLAAALACLQLHSSW